MRTFSLVLSCLVIIIGGCVESVTTDPASQINQPSDPPSDLIVPTNAGEMVAGDSSAGQMIAGQMIADQMIAGQMSAGQMSAGQMSMIICEDELCDALDNDCDGFVDEDALCPCDVDSACYGGPPSTRGIGICQDGDRSCDSTGEIWLECEEWVGPQEERCDDQDNDCDGQIDEGLRNSCGDCAIDDPIELCDDQDNDCDGQVDEGLRNACGDCAAEDPIEVCDDQDNDCDGQVDEGLRNACGVCLEDVIDEICDALDNDCDGLIDEGLRNACGDCGPTPEEVCDLVDNDCDGVVDEQGCLVQDLNLDGDCLTVTCPPRAPYPIACQIDFQGGDPRGCVAYRPPQSSVYLQEGNACGAGRVIGTLTCSNIPGTGLNAMNCPINKTDVSYPQNRNGCADTDD